MSKLCFFVFFGSVALICISGCMSVRHSRTMEDICGNDEVHHAAVIPATRPHKVWMDRHLQLLERVKQGNIALLFIGNSITQRWESSGVQAWEHYYGNRKAANLGVDGDGTQHVLWRLDHGEIDGISPKLVVLLIGSNHVNGYLPSEIADGMKAICCRLRTKLPDTKILLLGILPRGDASAAAAYRLNKASELASSMVDNRMIFYLDVGEKFLTVDGNVSSELTTVDNVHLSPEGYETLAAALEPTIAKLLNEKHK